MGLVLGSHKTCAADTRSGRSQLSCCHPDRREAKPNVVEGPCVPRGLQACEHSFGTRRESLTLVILSASERPALLIPTPPCWRHPERSRVWGERRDLAWSTPALLE